MSCYGFGSLHYIHSKGSSFSVLGGFQNVPGTNVSSHCHFCGGYVTSILSILNVGYGTWKVVNFFELCDSACVRDRPGLRCFVKADSHIACRAHAVPCHAVPLSV